MKSLTLVALLVGAVACQKTEDKKNFAADIKPGAGVGAGSAVLARPIQVPAPLDVKQPPPDAQKLPSGLAIKKLKTVADGASPARNDTVKVVVNGWLQSTGETFRASKGGEPELFPLSNAAPGFIEGLALMKTGERAMLWLPGSIGYREKPAAPEARVYEIELVDILAAPPTPPDVAGPPANAQTSPSGTKYVVVRPGQSNDKARPVDTVTFHYTAWDATGRMFDTSEIKKVPASIAPLKQSAILEEMLGLAPVGARVRFWAPIEKLHTSGKLPAGVTGQVCYEVDVQRIAKASGTLPPRPADVAKPPAAATKTPKGVSYRVLAAGTGEKPQASDSVEVKYTAWTSDGRVFDTWVIKGEPFKVALSGTTTGLADALLQLPVGSKARLWIPEELAFKGAPGKPQGMMTYDVELVAISKPKAPVDDGHGHGAHGDKPDVPAPVDVAGPPKDAKKTPLGVFYKVLSPGKGGPKPTASDRVRVHYSGWTTDGKMFDSSVQRGQPAEFALTGVIKGWTDGIPMMSVGDKARFWIPEELAYKGVSGRPQGMLVFDVELLEILGAQP